MLEQLTMDSADNLLPFNVICNGTNIAVSRSRRGSTLPLVDGVLVPTKFEMPQSMKERKIGGHKELSRPDRNKNRSTSSTFECDGEGGEARGGGQYFWFGHYVKFVILLENEQNFGRGPTHPQRQDQKYPWTFGKSVKFLQRYP